MKNRIQVKGVRKKQTLSLHSGTLSSYSLARTKILGVCWRVNMDQFIFNISDITTLTRNTEATKRNIVSVMGRFYNPLGCLAPAIVCSKILFQRLCEVKVDCDQLLDGELLNHWQSLVSDLLNAIILSVPNVF